MHIKGLGYFRYTLTSKGVKNLEDFDFQKQVQAVRVEFIPERVRIPSSKNYTRALVDTDEVEWIELPASAEDTTPTPDGGGSSSGGGGDDGNNPL